MSKYNSEIDSEIDSEIKTENNNSNLGCFQVSDSYNSSEDSEYTPPKYKQDLDYSEESDEFDIYDTPQNKEIKHNYSDNSNSDNSNNNSNSKTISPHSGYHVFILLPILFSIYITFPSDTYHIGVDTDLGQANQDYMNNCLNFLSVLYFNTCFGHALVIGFIWLALSRDISSFFLVAFSAMSLLITSNCNIIPEITFVYNIILLALGCMIL